MKKKKFRLNSDIYGKTEQVVWMVETFARLLRDLKYIKLHSWYEVSFGVKCHKGGEMKIDEIRVQKADE